MTREIRHGASRPDPHETRVSRVNRNAAGRVGSGQELFKISRVGSGRVNMFLTLVDRVGSGQQRFKSRASGRVRSRGFQNIGGQVGSGPDISKLSRVGSGQVTRPDPTRPVRFDLTREKPRKKPRYTSRGRLNFGVTFCSVLLRLTRDPPHPPYGVKTLLARLLHNSNFPRAYLIFFPV